MSPLPIEDTEHVDERRAAVGLGPLEEDIQNRIAQRLQQVSRGVAQVPQGSLYLALRRLENRGLLAAG
jgi:DNA-binding PadR family transcriptional regulator